MKFYMYKLWHYIVLSKLDVFLHLLHLLFTMLWNAMTKFASLITFVNYERYGWDNFFTDVSNIYVKINAIVSKMMMNIQE